MRHIYKITRIDSSTAPNKERTENTLDEAADVMQLFTEECADRMALGAQKAVVTIERFVIEDDT